MIRFLSITLLAFAIVFTAAPVVQAAFIIDQALGYDTFGAKSTGQTFTPSVGILPDPGTVSMLDLTAITLFHGNYADAAPSATTFLNIYDGDPHGSGSFVGSSSNSIDTTVGLSFFQPMDWTFNNLALDYNTEYWAIMSSTGTAGSLDVGVSLETHDRNLTGVYTGGTGLVANQVPHSKLVDAKFSIVFEAPGSLAADATTLSEATGGIVNFTLDAGAANANRDYIILGSFTGTSPGLPLPGGMVTLPLVWDQFCELTLSMGNSYALPNFRSSMDVNGQAAAQLNSLGPLPPGMLGLTLYFAYTLYSPPWNHCDFVSNPVSITIVP